MQIQDHGRQLYGRFWAETGQWLERDIIQWLITFAVPFFKLCLCYFAWTQDLFTDSFRHSILVINTLANSILTEQHFYLTSTCYLTFRFCLSFLCRMWVNILVLCQASNRFKMFCIPAWLKSCSKQLSRRFTSSGMRLPYFSTMLSLATSSMSSVCSA